MPTRMTIALGAIQVWVAGSCSLAVAQDKSDAIKKELELFKGVWTVVSTGPPIDRAGPDSKGIRTFIARGETVEFRDEDKVYLAGRLKLDPSSSPKAIDITIAEGPHKGLVYIGIYEFERDTMKLCFDPAGKRRPTRFDMSADSESDWVVLKRGFEGKKSTE